MKLLMIPLLLAALITGNYKLLHKQKNFTANKLNRFFMLQDTLQKPQVKLEQTTVPDMQVLYISDSATDMGNLTKVFEADYGELFTFISTNGLQPGKVMAFYLTYSNPIKLEVTVEVNKMPAAVLSGRINYKIVKGGDALVAHYTGPYEQMDIPYNAITKWLKENNKQPNGFPYEVYINDPAMVKNKYELKTDIYQMLQ